MGHRFDRGTYGPLECQYKFFFFATIPLPSSRRILYDIDLHVSLKSSEMGAPRRSPHDHNSSKEMLPGPTPTTPSLSQITKRLRKVRRQTGDLDRTSDLASSRDNFLLTAAKSSQDKNSSPSQQQQNNGTNGTPNPFSLCPQCVIRDNDPRVLYTGAWTLNGNQAMTQHSTTLSGSSIFLRFNGSGIVVFGTVPASDESNPPPTAVYSLDEQPFETTLPFAVSDVQSQPLFASMTVLSNEEHHIVVNVTSASTVPYIFEGFFIFPNMGSNKDVVGQVPTSSSNSTKAAATSTSATSTQSTSKSSMAASPNASHTTYDPQKVIRVLVGLLGALMVLIIGGIIVYAIYRRRLMAKQNDAKEKAPECRPDTVYTNFTSTESIMRYDSAIWSPFRSPRSQYSRSEGRAGHSTQSTSLRTSTNIDNTLPPPLPPKPVIFTSTIQR
ncbi:hypothetical protein BDN70DRAFT_667175 [Pholiota conissans]|uniref:Uncharacterized protein n=1 Tax=Pholiota conissans TaxID=109636 RepID=A0A9P6CTU7_9AGAR|nr:hypothetical protein BDN70DRAFT_667175 [Pholiota conissans]